MSPYTEIILDALVVVALAFLSGAGGSALLELYYRPRRDRHRAAKLLLAEILLNTELAILQAHARWKAMKKIPGDFRFSTVGWEAAAELVSELPAELLKALVILYNRYAACNHAVEMYVGAVADLKALPSGGSDRRKELENFLNSTVDVFNTGLDHIIDDGKKVLPEILQLAGIKEGKKSKGAPKDYQKVIDEFMAQREQRLKALEKQGE